MKKGKILLALVYATWLIPYHGNTQPNLKQNITADDPAQIRTNDNSCSEHAPNFNPGEKDLKFANPFEHLLKLLDSLGDIHNDAMAYSYEQLQKMNVASLTLADTREITADLTAEYFSNRYGQQYNFTKNQLKSEILQNGITPVSIENLEVSDQLKNTLRDVNRCLINLREDETADDLKQKVSQVTSTAYGVLTEKEKFYLKTYEIGITRSFEYWDQNAEAWNALAGPNRTAKTKSSNNSGKAFTTLFHRIAGPKKRHPCTAPIVDADIRGMIQGGIAGCITGAIFGVGVGCIPAGIFGAAVNGASASLGAAISCLIVQHAQN